MGILLCEQNFREVWRRNENVRAEIGHILHTHTRGSIISKDYHVCVHGKEVNVKGGGTVSVNTVHLMIYKYKYPKFVCCTYSYIMIYII